MGPISLATSSTEQVVLSRAAHPTASPTSGANCGVHARCVAEGFTGAPPVIRFPGSALIDAADGDELRVEDLLEAYGTRSFGPLIAILGLIALSPIGAVPGIPALLGLLISDYLPLRPLPK